MRKLLLFTAIFFYGMSSSYAGTNLTTIYGGGNAAGTDCGLGNVPLDAYTYTPGSSYTCTSHNYYVTDNYELNTSIGSPVNCNGEDRAIGVNGTKIICQKYDDTAPLGTFSLSPTAWTNTDVTVTITCSDTGGSDCDMSPILGWTESILSKTYSKVFTSNISSSINIKDNAGNVTNVPFSITNIDTTAPSLGDIGVSIPANFSNSAADYINISFTVGDGGGSPINYIGTFFEDSETSGSITGTLVTSSTPTWTNLENLTNVDRNRLGDGSRQYTLRVSKICDEALNCIGDLLNTTRIKDFYYNVYPNTNTPRVVSLEGVDNLKNISDNNVADGSEDTLKIVLKDIYGNAIIPASGISRTIDFNFDVNNTLDYDQTNLIFEDAVYLNPPSNIGFDNRLTSSNNFDDQPSTNGEYPFKFKVYAPTSNIFPSSTGDFTINSINYDINDSVFSNYSLAPITGSNIEFNFKPIYTTIVSGELTSSGFIEGRTQTGSLQINEDTDLSGTATISAKKLFLVQTGATSSYFTGSGVITTNDTDEVSKRINTDFTDGNLVISPSSGLPLFNQLYNTNYVLKTLFTLLPGPGFIDDIVDVNLFQYIEYQVDSKTIKYKVGELNNGNTQNIETFKVYGTTNIDASKVEDLTEFQSTEDIQNLAGKIDKASLKRDIRKNAINTVKVVTPTNTGATIDSIPVGNWTDTSIGVPLGDILYYGDMGGNNVILDTTTNVNGRKTIVVIGGNLYIKSNIINSSSGNPILGIIVLEDENGKGGKLYIDTGVSRVDAIIYTDKSVISYNEVYNNGDGDIQGITNHEVDGNINNSVLQNQLYIFGSVFSENTIGGSRKSPPVCPFWTKATSIVCDVIEAQKYDFNYLRSGKDNPEFTDPDGTVYPVVIRYNSALQSTPPPLFDN